MAELRKETSFLRDHVPESCEQIAYKYISISTKKYCTIRKLMPRKIVETDDSEDVQVLATADRT